MPGEQTVLHSEPRGRVVAVDSAYDAQASNRGRDVVVNASYCGVLPARFIAEHAPRGAIAVDCAVGPEGVGIAGLWYLEAVGVPAAAAAVSTVVLGDGVAMCRYGVISHVNELARGCAVAPGMTVMDAAIQLLREDPQRPAAAQITNREVMHTAPGGRSIICTDSIAFGLPEDLGRNVLCTAGHTGRSAVPYLKTVSPWGFICSDGGRGRDDSGIAGLTLVEPLGLAGATVDARSARMGDGHSTFHDGVISACNRHALARGVELGQPARDAAVALLAG